MARTKNEDNGRGDESLKALKQAQVQMLQAMATLALNQTLQLQALQNLSQHTDTEIDKLRRGMEERFAQVDERLSRIEAILTALPQAVHREFGFRPPPSAAPPTSA